MRKGINRGKLKETLFEAERSMLFLWSLGFVLLFAGKAGKYLKKYPLYFYLGGFLLSAIMIFGTAKGWYDHLPGVVSRWALEPFLYGSIAAALFTVVMYLGIRDFLGLKRLRGELSLLGFFLTLGHNGTFICRTVLAVRAGEALPGNQMAASKITVAAFCLLLILAVTSMKPVRKRMKAARWKAVQKLAYVFYGMIYLHVMTICLPEIGTMFRLLDVVVYTTVFGGYYLLRLRKGMVRKRRVTVQPSG